MTEKDDSHAAFIRAVNPIKTPKRKRRSVDRDGYVYVVQAGGRGGPVKIGIALDPDYRVLELQCGNHLDLKLLHTMSGGRELENRLHKELVAHRIRGEWFKLTPEVLAAVSKALLEPGRISQQTRLYSSGCEVCGTPACGPSENRLCNACREFKDLREADGDPFAEEAA